MFISFSTSILVSDDLKDGRRPLYLTSLPFLIFGSIGVAAALNVPSLLFWRFIQSVGAAPAMVVGAGVCGDIYKLEERGRAMGVFFGVRYLSDHN
jgi:MFS family permease